MMFWYGYGSSWPFWQVALMWVGMVAFWALVIWAVYAGVRAVAAPRDSGVDGAAARRILDERLARGEIGADEYERVLDLIAPGSGRSTRGKVSGR